MCYDGVEGLLYLCLFSLLAAGALTVMLCAIFRVWTLMASRSAPANSLISLRTAHNILLQSGDARTPPDHCLCLYRMHNCNPGTESMATSMTRTHSTLKLGECPTTQDGPISIASVVIPAASAVRPAFTLLHRLLPMSCRPLNTCKISR